jgi:hypothetical protein
MEMQMIKHIKKITKLRFEKAQTFVEFALVFPIVLLLTYGIIEFGRMVFIYASVTGAAREGARYGAAYGGDTIPQYANCPGIKDAVHNAAGAFLVSIPDTDISISYDKGSGLSVIGSCGTISPGDIKLGNRIIVRVTAHYEPVIGNFLGISGFPIVSTNARTIIMKVKIEPYP